MKNLKLTYLNRWVVNLMLSWTLALVSVGGPAALGQPAQEGAQTASGPEAEHKEKEAEGPGAFEAEFVASDIFRSGSYVQPLWRGLGFEGHYFGGTETDVAFTGASWTFRLGELKLIPGFGVMFGSNRFATTPVFSFRWKYERKWFVTEGLVLQGFRKTPIFEEEGEEGDTEHEESAIPTGYVRPTISDGNHVSVRWKRLTVGGTWEHIQFREGEEWKTGGRLAIRILPRISGILYVLTPGRTEWRGGILIHPPE
ncbi:MAG TPA: hypothetical protein VFR10_10440 [bacterium]|nr:hypothetical protein [bacterium]